MKPAGRLSVTESREELKAPEEKTQPLLCSFVSWFGDAPGGREQSRALPLLLPPLQHLALGSRCGVGRPSPHLHPGAAAGSAGPGGLGVGFWIVPPAPAPQFPCRQPLRDGVPGETRQLHPAVLAAAVLPDLLGEHRRAQGVRPVPSAGPAEQGRAAGRVLLQRGGGVRPLLRPPGQGGDGGNPLRPPEHVRDNPDHGDRVCFAEREEERGERAGRAHKHEAEFRQHQGRHRQQSGHGRPLGEAVLFFRKHASQHSLSTHQTHPAVTPWETPTLRHSCNLNTNVLFNCVTI